MKSTRIRHACQASFPVTNFVFLEGKKRNKKGKVVISIPSLRLHKTSDNILAYNTSPSAGTLLGTVLLALSSWFQPCCPWLEHLLHILKKSLSLILTTKSY